MQENAGIYREEGGLKAACATLSRLRRRYLGVGLTDRTNGYNTDLLQALELGSMLNPAVLTSVWILSSVTTVNSPRIRWLTSARMNLRALIIVMW